MQLDQAAVLALAPFDVAFIRHGNTAPNTVDTERVLTDLGRQQSQSAASSYMKSLPCMDMAALAVCSPAVRCKETAELVLAGAAPTPERIDCPCIYDALLQPGAKGIFKKLSYAPLKDYFAEGAEVVEILDAYATGVINEVGSIAAARPEANAGSGRRTLCVFGHAVYSAAVAHL